jgi:DNA-binding IclR family transcriptional regulator
VPLWESATGRVFVAYLPPRETVGPLAKEGVDCRASAFRDEVARIRTAGCSIMNDGGDFAGIAAPVFAPEGRLAGVLTLSRPFTDNNVEHRGELALIAQNAAAAISRRIARPRTA